MDLLRITRIAAIASLAIFIVSLPLIWTGVVPAPVRVPLATVTGIALFGSAAAYIVCFGYRFSQPTPDESAVANSTDPDLGYAAAEVKSLIAWQGSQAAGLRIWGGLMSILVLGVIGSLISTEVGVAGTAVGAALTLMAVAFYVRSIIRLYGSRQDVWLKLGRRRWQFVAYVVATFVLALIAGAGRYLYHSNAVTGAAIVIALLLLIRLRLFMQDFW
jgi:hypothetical protein